MFKKFTEGLVFGSGFGISFVLVWYIASYLIYPISVGPQIQKAASNLASKASPSVSSQPEVFANSGKQFHELSLEEQIQQASVIAMAKYEKSSDGKMKAIIKEFLKKKPDTTIYYSIGDEFPESSYYPKENVMYGDGVIVFFTGSPATMKMSMTYSGDRIRSLGDIPMKLFKKKCKDKNT